MGRLVWFATLVLALALGTYGFGWLSVPVLAVAWTAIRREDPATPILSAVAGLTAWGLLLAVQATFAPIGDVARVVGSAMQVGAGALTGLTLAFPALLAGAAAGLVRGLVPKAS